MATGKKYYWIKLKDTFMTSDKVDFLMSQPNGADYIVLYQMLCLKTINTNGELARSIGEIIMPFDVEKIKRDCKYFSGDTIRVALELYKKLGMIYEQENGILRITEFSDLVGSATDYAKQKAIQRENKKLELTMDKGVDNVHIDIRDKENKILDNKILDNYTNTKTKRFVKPTIEELQAYCEEKNMVVDCDKFLNYYESNGWMVGKNHMKNWKAALTNWSKRSFGYSQPQVKNNTEWLQEYKTREVDTYDYELDTSLTNDFLKGE